MITWGQPKFGKIIRRSLYALPGGSATPKPAGYSWQLSEVCWKPCRLCLPKNHKSYPFKPQKERLIGCGQRHKKSIELKFSKPFFSPRVCAASPFGWHLHSKLLESMSKDIEKDGISHHFTEVVVLVSQDFKKNGETLEL